MRISDMQHAAHLVARGKGFWPEGDGTCNKALGLKAALIASEAIELMEAYRKGPEAPCDKSGVELSREEEEMADVALRLFDLAEARGIDLEEAIRRKNLYNKSRPSRHGGRAF